MAYIYNNKKGFKVIRTENRAEALMLGGAGVCDWCNIKSKTGYYVAVLNHWYCDACFHDFYCRAVFYKEDMKIEMKNYNRFLPVYGLNDSETGPMKEFEDNDGCTYTLDQLEALHQAHDTDKEFILDDDDIEKIKELDVQEEINTQNGWIKRIK